MLNAVGEVLLGVVGLINIKGGEALARVEVDEVVFGPIEAEQLKINLVKANLIELAAENGLRAKKPEEVAFQLAEFLEVQLVYRS